MKQIGACLALALVGCVSVNLVGKYDEVVDKGVVEFAEQLGAHMKNMAAAGGTADGTYAANVRVYNALEAKLDVLIARSEANAAGVSCKLEDKVYEKVRLVLKDHAPPGLVSGEATADSAAACSSRLLSLVRDQLTSIRELHQIDRCRAVACGERDAAAAKCEPNISCLRVATAKSAMDITSQSINAVAVVEAAKRPK